MIFGWGNTLDKYSWHEKAGIFWWPIVFGTMIIKQTS